MRLQLGGLLRRLRGTRRALLTPPEGPAQPAGPWRRGMPAQRPDAARPGTWPQPRTRGTPDGRGQPQGRESASRAPRHSAGQNGTRPQRGPVGQNGTRKQSENAGQNGTSVQSENAGRNGTWVPRGTGGQNGTWVPRGTGGQNGTGAQPGTAGPPAGAGRSGGERQARAGTGDGRPGRSASHALPRRRGIARLATRAAPRAAAAARQATQVQLGRAARAAAEPKPPWYEIAERNRTAPGHRHCGRLEELIHREWAESAAPPPEVVRAIDRLAELPQLIKSKLAAGLDAIHVGAGGVPDLDDMAGLRGVPLPGGRASWDACAGAYGDRKIIVGSRPSPTPDVTCHEVGHALDDLDGVRGEWQSDSAEFQSLYTQCRPYLASAFHQQPGYLGRREFFADAFSAIASRQRPALVEMLSGDTRTALNVMLFFNVRYGI
jgi:hypothetical protein